MKICFSTNGRLRDKLGVEECKLEMPQISTLGDVVSIIANKLDNNGKKILVDIDGNLQRGLLIVINDEMIQGDVNHQIEDGDNVSILMPMAGG